MKKITLNLILFMLLVSTAQSQSFEKGNFNIDLGIGIGVYATHQKNTQTVVAGGLTQTQKSDTTDGAASFIVPISFEYGISNKFGIGADLTFSNYFIAEEDKPNLKSVKGFDFGLKFNYHIISSKRNDLFVGFGFGISSLSWNAQPQPNQIIDGYSGVGSYWNICISDRIFFMDNIGIIFNMSYRGYSYTGLEANLTSEGEDLVKLLDKFEQKIDWTFNGVNVGLGVAVKF